MRGYDVTFAVWNSEDWDWAPEGKAHPESAGQRSNEDIRCGILEIHNLDAQGNGCCDAFVWWWCWWWGWGEVVIHFYGGIADPLRAMAKQDANLISHLGSNKPIVTGSFS